jgi:hypothetical protein
MKASTWQAVFATMNPSPVFETIAEFAELRADHRPTAFPEQIDDANDACQVALCGCYSRRTRAGTAASIEQTSGGIRSYDGAL